MSEKTVEKSTTSTEPSYDTELSIYNLKKFLSDFNNVIILKFTATWCGPCQRIKTLCNDYFLQMSDNILCLNLDIDKEANIELYSALKAKKMVKGVPTLFAYNCAIKRDMNNWYIPDLSISGSDQKQVVHFFESVKKLA